MSKNEKKYNGSTFKKKLFNQSVCHFDVIGDIVEAR